MSWPTTAHRALGPVVLAAVVLLSAPLAAGPPSQPAPAGATSYVLDRESSLVTVHVGKTGLFSFAGHTHEVEAPLAEGTIAFTPQEPTRSELRLAFDASALRVTGRGEPPDDVPEVQRTMESARVLDVGRYPRITFASTAIAVESQSADHLDLHVIGDLTVHGITRSESADVSVDVAGPDLTAVGTLRIRQTDYGIEPVTAGAGTVRVKDALDIEFRILAHASSNGRASGHS